MSIGTRIIHFRNQKEMTQQELSRRCGIAASYLSRVENRRLEPGPKTLRRIAQALEVPISELFEESRESMRTSQCAITVSGNCIMEMLRSERGRAAHPERESYTPRQLQLLRIASYLIQSRDSRLLDALDVLLNSLLSSVGQWGGAGSAAATSRIESHSSLRAPGS